MHVVENAVDIDRPREAVFDYCSDMRTEAGWNPAVRSVEMVSAEPVRVGSRFVGSFTGLGRAVVEVVEYDRPARWIARSTAGRLPFRLVGTVADRGPGRSRLTVRIELFPTGPLGVLFPVVRLLMQPTAKANLGRIKAAVER
jgi:uncharacterized protein YndB with AHSA1/START domain